MRSHHRNATIFAGIFTTIQGVAWAFVSIYSIGIYGCTFDFPFKDDDKSVWNLMYFSYFIGKCRFSDSVQNAPPPPSLDYTHPHRTYILQLIYGILSAIWIPCSILLLVASVNKIHGRRGARCYWPWIIVTGIILLYDIATTIIYIFDIANSMTVDNYKAYFHYPYSLKGMDGITVVPAVIMTAASSRIIIIYIINAVLFGVVIQACRVVKRLSPAAVFVEFDARLAPTKGFGQTSSWVRMGKKPVRVPEVSPASRVEEVDLQRFQERPEVCFQKVEKRPERPNMLALEGAKRQPRPALKPLPINSPSDPPPPPPLGINSPTPKSPVPFYDVFGKPTTPDSPQPAMVHTRSPLADGVDNKVPWSYMIPQQPHAKPIPEPDYTIRPKRSSPTYNKTPSDEGDRASLPRRSEGVNKNMPWSYMNPQHLPPKHIPEPDYTIRGKKTPTPNSTPSDEDVAPPSRRYENNPNVWKVM